MSKAKSIASFTSFITRFPTQKSLIEKLYLPAILESYTRVRLIENIRTKSENQIRNDIERDLKKRNTIISHIIKRNTIFLNSEAQILTETEVYRTDIKFSFHEREDFVIECKKLSSAENRYIQGHFDNTKGEYVFDGMERFTANIYSASAKNASMLAFVINPNIQTVMNSLIEKVVAFKFVSGQEKLLTTKCVKYTHSFQSKHHRDDKSTIHIYHILLEI